MRRVPVLGRSAEPRKDEANGIPSDSAGCFSLGHVHEVLSPRLYVGFFSQSRLPKLRDRPRRFMKGRCGLVLQRLQTTSARVVQEPSTRSAFTTDLLCACMGVPCAPAREGDDERRGAALQPAIAAAAPHSCRGVFVICWRTGR